MRYIEISCIDKDLSTKVTREVDKRLKSLGFASVGVALEDCLFSEAARLLKTYPAIRMNRMTGIYLEAARNYQAYIECVFPFRMKDYIVTKSGSFFVDTVSASLNEDAKIMITRYILRRFPLKPEHIFFLDINFNKFMERRRKASHEERIEDRIRGRGARAKYNRYIPALEKIKSKYKINYSIIKSDDNPEDVTPIIDGIVKTLLENGLLERVKIDESKSSSIEDISS